MTGNTYHGITTTTGGTTSIGQAAVGDGAVFNATQPGSGGSPRPGRDTNQLDVLIITALPEEFQAAKLAANGVAQWAENDTGGLTPYLTGSYRTAGGDHLSVALARPTRMSGRSTSVVSTILTDHLKPTCLAMPGVCAGEPSDTAPGDVVIAAPAYEYDEGKHRGADFQGDHQQYPLEDRWLRAAQDFDPSALPSYGPATEHEAVVWFLERLYRRQDARTHPARTRYFPRGTWQPRLQQWETGGLITWRPGGWALTEAGAAMIERVLDDDVDGPDELPFAVHAGPMASGSAVIQDPEIWMRLKQMGNRKILALEMEAATIGTVATARQVPHWLVAKGVMDRADFEKDDRFKAFAARASAEVLYALLGQVLSPAFQPQDTTGPRGPEPAGRARGTFSGATKLEVIRRLHYDWQDLADLFGVPPFERARFGRGDEPRALWEWLEIRGRLPELADALDELGRTDLADLLRQHQA
jgi:nucleoside phosphorylase